MTGYTNITGEEMECEGCYNAANRWYEDGEILCHTCARIHKQTNAPTSAQSKEGKDE